MKDHSSKIFISIYFSIDFFLLYRYWWNTRIFPFTKKSHLYRALWRYYFYLSHVGILVSPWLTRLANYKRTSRSGAQLVLLKFHSQNGFEVRRHKRLNTGMAPTCNWMIKIVKVNRLYLNSLSVSIVNRVSQSGTIKYQCEWKHRSVKKEMITYVAKGRQPFLFSEVVQRYSSDEKVIG